jgi:GntR family transcriptional regulator, carbon starvation induced regulator
LQIEAMSERYGIGAAPVREALNRLSSEGLVERRSQRGFFVTRFP